MVATRQKAIRSLVTVAAVASLYFVFVRSEIGQAIDRVSIGSLAWAGPVAQALGDGRTILLGLAVAGAAASALSGLFRGFGVLPVAGSALIIAAVAFGSPFLRDHVFIRPVLVNVPAYNHNTFPSSHAALAVAAAGVIIYFLPKLRAARVAAVVLACLVSVGSVSWHAHRLSDVIAGALLALALLVWLPGGARPVRPYWRRTLLVVAGFFGAVVVSFAAALLGADLVAQVILGCAVAGTIVACVVAALWVGAQRIPDVQHSGSAGGRPGALRV